MRFKAATAFYFSEMLGTRETNEAHPLLQVLPATDLDAIDKRITLPESRVEQLIVIAFIKSESLFLEHGGDFFDERFRIAAPGNARIASLFLEGNAKISIGQSSQIVEYERRVQEESGDVQLVLLFSYWKPEILRQIRDKRF
ncbi:hypothetical protein J4419_00155 [Candidatus Woesearchaeota archaeon]|nr:hypothetical protein [Candidatus Woesearchaeota archaeon]